MSRQFGPYELVRQIAVGGMAEIHLAKTSGIAGFEKYVALKMIHPNFSQDQQFIEMLIDEAKITVQLQHVNIAQTFDLGRVNQTYYITMEFVDGADLYKLLRRGSERDRDVPVPIAGYIAKEIATGLDYAHRKRDVTGQPLGIVHRDVSPQNVLISYAGEIKLVDFGIAKATMRARQTAVGVIKGKYYYMSPEQAWGDPLDRRTDVFSTGILLYEMLTGQMLYLEEDLHKLLDMVRKAAIAPPTVLRRDIPPQLERIVMHCLQKRPEDRYQSGSDLATDLERFLHAYAPVFTATKVANWIADVLGDEEPPAPDIEVEKPPADARRETKRLTRDQLIVERGEIADENSVIFDVADLMKDAPESTDTRSVPPLFAPAPPRSATARPPPIPGAKPSLNVRRSMPAEQDKPAESVAGRARAAGRARGEAAAKPNPVPSPRLARPTPRSANVPTQQIVDVDAPTEMADRRHDLSEMDDRTVVSGPPGFGIGDGPDDNDRTVPDRVRPSIDEQDATLIQRHTAPLSPMEEDDEVDDDAPTFSSEDSDLDATNVAVRSAPPATAQNRESWERLPALAASNPTPAVSALRQPRQSKRTPPDGIPTGPSVLSSILGKSHGGRVPQVAMAPTGVDPSSGQGADPNQPLQPGPFPPPSPVGPIPPLPLAPSTEHTPGPFPGLPTGIPQSTTKQLQAIELDEIPDRYKIGQRRNPLLLWGGIGLLAALVVGAVVAFSLGGGDEPTRFASIEIVSKPEGADVFVDGDKLKSTTPTLYSEARAGKTYLIVVDLAGYQRWEKEERIPAEGGSHSVVAQLDKVVVSLSVSSEPPGASVYINNTPMGRTPLVLPNLDPATHTTLELRKKGFRPVRRSLDWTNETEKNLRIPLER